MAGRVRTVLIVDGDARGREDLRRELEWRDEDIICMEAESASGALAICLDIAINVLLIAEDLHGFRGRDLINLLPVYTNTSLVLLLSNEAALVGDLTGITVVEKDPNVVWEKMEDHHAVV